MPTAAGRSRRTGASSIPVRRRSVRSGRGRRIGGGRGTAGPATDGHWAGPPPRAGRSVQSARGTAILPPNRGEADQPSPRVGVQPEPTKQGRRDGVPPRWWRPRDPVIPGPNPRRGTRLRRDDGPYLGTDAGDTGSRNRTVEPGAGCDSAPTGRGTDCAGDVPTRGIPPRPSFGRTLSRSRGVIRIPGITVP